MIAVTIGVGKKHKLMAELAAESCRICTKLPTFVLSDEHYERHCLSTPELLKFRLFDEFPDEDRILFFDADTIFLKQFETQKIFNTPHFMAVRDNYDAEFIVDDARRIGIEPREYFNSGVFVIHRSQHQDYLSFAEKLFHAIPCPFADQTALNMARKLMNLPISFLPEEYNHIQFFLEPRKTTTVIGHFISLNVKPLTLENIRKLYESPYELPSLHRDSQ